MMADKRILVVAVGDAGPPQLNMSRAQLAALRPLLGHMKDGLDTRGGGDNTPVFDAVTAPPGPGLQQAIQAYLGQFTPDVIVPVASAATRAARDAVAPMPSATRIPIVFTVVSEPDKEPSGDPL